MVSMRIAICQLESHTAIANGTELAMEEPFPGYPMSLAALSKAGIDVSAAQTACMNRYLDWNRKRIAAILRVLSSEQMPDIVIFPEGSIAPELLPEIATWSKDSFAAVAAGSHTPRKTCRVAYEQAGADAKQLERVFGGAVTNAAPWISKGKTRFVVKGAKSPMELNDVHHERSQRPIESFPLALTDGDGAQTYWVSPLICAEALTNPSIPSKVSLVVVLADDAKPAQFQHVFAAHIHNKKAVAFCNDGRTGGSRLMHVQDVRQKSVFLDIFPDGLPPGDAVIVVDVTLDAQAVEYGTAIPASPVSLVKVMAVVGGLSAAGAVPEQLAAVEMLTGSKADELRKLCTGGVSETQRAKLSYLMVLEQKGLPSKPYFDALAGDCVIPDEPDLPGLEGELATLCLSLIPSEPPQAEQGIIAWSRFNAECRKRSPRLAEVAAASEANLPRPSFIGRQPDIDRLLRILDANEGEPVEVSGLREIGKTELLRHVGSLAGAGVKWIPIQSTSSPEFLVFAVQSLCGAANEPPYADVVREAKDPRVARGLATCRFVVLENAHHLVDRDHWRDPRLAGVLDGILDAATQTRTRIVFESRTHLPLSHLRTPIRLRVHGFWKNQEDDGLRIFDSRLRAHGVRPDDAADDERRRVVRALGGHPRALAIAASVASTEGWTELSKGIRSGSGDVVTYVRQLIDLAVLADEEQLILSLLSAARGGVPKEALLLALESESSGKSLRRLVGMGAVDEEMGGSVEIAPVLRNLSTAVSVEKAVLDNFYNAIYQQLVAIARERATPVQVSLDLDYYATLIGKALPDTMVLQDGVVAAAKALYEQGRFSEVVALLEPTVHRFPSSDIKRLILLSLGSLGQFDKLMPLAGSAFVANPRDTYLLRELSMMAMRTHNEESAQHLVRLARQAHMDEAEVLTTDGLLAMRRGQLRVAEERLRRARQLTSRNIWLYYHHARVLLEMGETEEAQNVLLMGLDIAAERGRNDRVIDLMNAKLAYSHYLAGDLATAKTLVESLLHADKTNVELQRLYVAVSIKLDGLTDAADIAMHLKMSDARSGHDRALCEFLLGRFYLGVGAVDEAIIHLRSACRLQPNDVSMGVELVEALTIAAEGQHRDGNSRFGMSLQEAAREMSALKAINQDSQIVQNAERKLVTTSRRLGV